MTDFEAEPVKQAVTAHWDRRAPGFDQESDHAIHGEAEQRAWDRALDLLLAARTGLDVLDVGCGTGFLALQLAARGNRAVGIDLAPAMIAEAQRKAASAGLTVTFALGDAEQTHFEPDSFDLVISRHVLWTLPHPGAALDEWIRVTRPGGRVAIIDGQWNTAQRPHDEYSGIRDSLPFYGGRPQAEIQALLGAHGLEQVGCDDFADLVAALRERALSEGRQPGTNGRHVVWGDVPA